MNRACPGLLSAVVALGACSPASDGESGTAEPAPSAAERWALVEELRIGSVADPDLSLTRVSGLAVDAAGRVYVAQPQDNLIRVFDGEGRPTLTIGGPGQGPGEFQRLTAIGLLADTLYASDLTPRRVSFFSLTGELLATQTIRPQVSEPFSPGVPHLLFPDGTALSTVGVPVGLPGLDLTRIPYLRFDRAGQILDTMAWDRQDRIFRTATADNGATVGGGLQPFADNPLIAISFDGERIVEIERWPADAPGPSTFRVTIMDARRDTVASRVVDYEPVPMVATLVDSLVAASASTRLQFFASQEAAVEAIRAVTFVPEYFVPAVEALYSTTRDLWIRREDLPGRDQSWIVFDDAAQPLAEATVPHGFDVLHITADAVWGVDLDDLDVPYVVKYRIERAP